MFHRLKMNLKTQKKLATVLAQCTINQSSYSLY